MSLKKIALSALVLGTVALVSKKGNNKLKPIKNFNLNNFLGLWYQMGQLDTFWGRDTNQITFRFLLNEDKTIQFIKRGFDEVTESWKTSKFNLIGSENNTGLLKEKGFSILAESYKILEIDTDYKYVLIAGKNLDYLWILSREKSIPKKIKDEFISKAKELNFDTNKIIWTKHS